MTKIKIANIYNDYDNVNMDIYWNSKTKEITYKNVENEEEWSSDEFADTLQEAIDDIYAKYYSGWYLEFYEGD